MSWLATRARSFGYAGKGLVTLFSSQPNAKIHLVATIFVTALAYYVGINSVEWAILILAISLVIAMEALNTSLEFLADALHPEHHPLVGKAKDVAAAAVLICSFGAALVGLVLLLPPLLLFF